MKSNPSGTILRIVVSQLCIHIPLRCVGDPEPHPHRNGLRFSSFIYLISRRLQLRRLGFYGGMLFLFLGIMTFIFGQIEVNDIRRTNEAIVFSGTVNVLSGPKEGSTTLFVIHEGLKVEILESTGSWDRIILPNGSIGWIENSATVVI